MKAWLIHWTSAALIAALILTALPLAALSVLRPTPRAWPDLHLTLGWTLASLTVFRLAMLYPARAGSLWAKPFKLRSAFKAALLTATVLVVATGTVIYRASPLNGGAMIFGFIEAGPLVALSHRAHMQLLTFHRAASYALLLLIAAHIVFAFRRTGPAERLPIAWMWMPHEKR